MMATLLFASCATIAPCVGSLMPIVEVQVNNTASNHDDYGTTGADTVARARITNTARFGGGNNFPGGVAVELRNPSGSSNLTFSSSAGAAGSASMFQTLPDTGDWSTFFVKGTATTTLDKSTVIEMATSGTCDEVVVARKAMMIPSGAPPIPAAPARPRVEIEIGSVATLDDYIAWGPTFSRLRWADGTPGATLNVTLQNMAGADHLRFAAAVASDATATSTTLPLTLNGNGAWVTFYVAGNFASPSVIDKDAVLEVTSAGSLLSREGLMVRIRKNANLLSTAERKRFLDALKKVSQTYLDYIDFVKTHSRDSTGAIGSLVAHRQAHSGSAFLPWHRAFILHIERLLQSADPSVALPYWRFDENAPNVFTQDFMGENSGGNVATLAAGNPIVSWSLPGEAVPAGIQRQTPYGNGGHPLVATEIATLGLGSPGFTYASFLGMEVNAHNPAHFRSGFTDATGTPVAGASWIAGSPAIAPRDPLFFLLHANVDRLWAKWQWLRGRNTVTDVATYNLQGSYAVPGAGVAAPLFTTDVTTGQITANRTLGQYADDTMWPWDNVAGGTGTAARPNIAVLTPFPITLGGLLPFNKPTVKLVINYPGMGFGYDDVNPY
jgi:tyrosinase